MVYGEGWLKLDSSHFSNSQAMGTKFHLPFTNTFYATGGASQQQTREIANNLAGLWLEAGAVACLSSCAPWRQKKSV
jgi:hypothetical protein